MSLQPCKLNRICMANILLTGATGFLGSHIAKKLLSSGNKVIATRRSESNAWRCAEFYDQIQWIDIEDSAWKGNLSDSGISVIIHAAWIGVEAADRDDVRIQSKNIDLIIELLELGNAIKVEKFIFLGSQAEYGILNDIVTEDLSCNPSNAYGAVKLAALEIVKFFCAKNNITWVWLRVFSLFGPKENRSWLIPALLSKIKTEKEMDFTLGLQKYAYLFVDDFTLIISRIVALPVRTGVYNVSGIEPLYLKDIIRKIVSVVNPEFKLNFGVLPYRDSQSMHIQGDMSKLIMEIDSIEFSNFDKSLANTIRYYNNTTDYESL
jgi:nucleoside-diphosphate-sugar epimerase